MGTYKREQQLEGRMGWMEGGDTESQEATVFSASAFCRGSGGGWVNADASSSSGGACVDGLRLLPFPRVFDPLKGK